MYLAVQEKKITDGIIFLQYSGEFGAQWYARNNPDLSGNIFVPDGGARNRELAVHFPEKTTYLYHFNNQKYIVEKVRL
jgi:hypothetical protein